MDRSSLWGVWEYAAHGLGMAFPSDMRYARTTSLKRSRGQNEMQISDAGGIGLTYLSVRPHIVVGDPPPTRASFRPQLVRAL